MTVEQTNKIDYASVDKNSGELLLTISDHLPWGENDERHLYLIQEKINSYLRFIESGEIESKIQQAKGRTITINVVGKFPLSEQANLFFSRFRKVIQESGYDLRFSLMQPN